jgi:hypothetical protein
MTVTRDRLNGGSLKLLDGVGATLATVSLGNPSGNVSGDTITFAGFPKTVAASVGGTAAGGSFANSGGGDEKTGLTVGLPASLAPAWAQSTSYSVGNVRTNGPNIYRCTQAGTSDIGGGPSGTSTSIPDNTVTWAWVCPAGAAIQIDNGSSTLVLSAGAAVTISGSPAPTLVHAA